MNAIRRDEQLVRVGKVYTTQDGQRMAVAAGRPALAVRLPEGVEIVADDFIVVRTLVSGEHRFIEVVR
jgi:hypothetical protein